MEDRYLSVSELSEIIRRAFHTSPFMQNVTVQGELFGFKRSTLRNGQPYCSFGLKDETAQLYCVIWARDLKQVLAAYPEPENGKMVAVHGYMDYYLNQGRPQLTVRQMKEVGLGQASQALLKLQKKLEAEGLFSAEWKKPIPRHPRVVGIITSAQGQAIRDIQDVAGRRNPYVQLVLYPTTVQGKQAAEGIVKAIEVMDAYGADVLIVGRGGGSEEDLAVYNDERIVRAVFAARTPVVSAVGHAGNTTLIDMVADMRAATPSEAAELTVPDVMSVLNRLRSLSRESRAGLHLQLQRKCQRLEQAKSNLEIHHPRHILERRQNRLGNLKTALQLNMREQWNRRYQRFRVAATELHGLAPTAKLVKGFGYILLEGNPLTDVELAHPGDALNIRIHNGEVEGSVTGIRRKEDA